LNRAKSNDAGRRRRAFAPTAATSRTVPRACTEPSPYRTLRPASVRRFARRGPLPLALHRPAPPFRARHAFPPRRLTSGRAAVPWPAPTHVAPHCPCRDPDCFPSPWCASQSLHHLELAYIKGIAVLLRATQHHHAAITAAHGVTVNLCSGRLHRSTVPLLSSSCSTKAPTLAGWPTRAAGSPEQSSPRPPPPVSAVPPTGPVFAASEYPDRVLSTPSSSPATPRPSSPARSLGLLLAAPPSTPGTTLQRPK
jgi:hypothetical protein